MTNEDFYESAIRHWLDGCILEQKEEYDNAVCLQGFAAECALKKIMEKITCNGDVKKYSHFGAALFQDMKMILSGDMVLAAIIDPAWGLRLSSLSLPEILFPRATSQVDAPPRIFGDCREGQQPRSSLRGC